MKPKENINGIDKSNVESVKNKYSNPEELKKGDEKYIKMNKVLNAVAKERVVMQENNLRSIFVEGNEEIKGLFDVKNKTEEQEEALKTIYSIFDEIRRDKYAPFSLTLSKIKNRFASEKLRNKLILVGTIRRPDGNTAQEVVALRNILSFMDYDMSSGYGSMTKEEFEAAKERSKNVKIS